MTAKEVNVVSSLGGAVCGGAVFYFLFPDAPFGFTIAFFVLGAVIGFKVAQRRDRQRGIDEDDEVG